MNSKEKFDFCLIHSPYNGEKRIVIFLTARGLEYIDETIIMDPNYRKVKLFLEENGLIEIEFCSFESISEFDEEFIILGLEEKNVRYSKSLELKISKEMDDLKDEHQTLFSNDIQPIYFSNPNSNIELDSSLIRIPLVGEKISLYFYLFLECHFIKNDDYVLLLNGEFYTNEDNHFRNFLKITKSEFIRIESDIPNVVILQSTKKYKDFASEVNLLHSGKFKLLKPRIEEGMESPGKTKEYVYNFVEILKNINPDHHVVIQVSLDGYFAQMLERSKEIKRELTKIKKNTISINFIREEANQIKSKLEEKMIDFAELDQYEKASFFKKNINLLDSKLKMINDINEDSITVADYMKIFSLE